MNRSFSGGTVHIAQWTDDTYDYDMTSIGVYQAHIATIGWQSSVSDGATAGTTGRSLPMEALRLSVAGDRLSGDILWRGHVQNVGWQPWVADGGTAGTSGMGRQIEAVQILLAPRTGG